LAISAFVTPSLIGGPRVEVMATLIYQESMALLNWPSGAAIAFVMLFTLLVLFALAFQIAGRARAAEAQ
jgi:putative spermidine/putrescine transport system permease protein